MDMENVPELPQEREPKEGMHKFNRAERFGE